MVDIVQVECEDSEEEGIKKVFINVYKVEEGGNLWLYEEGCFSILDVWGEVECLVQICLCYMDENFEEYEEVFIGFNVWVIQYEYDYIDGILFMEYFKLIKCCFIC